MIGFVPNEARPPAGFGCLSTIIGVIVLAAIVAAALAAEPKPTSTVEP